jgi:hypothetical protein
VCNIFFLKNTDFWGFLAEPRHPAAYYLCVGRGLYVHRGMLIH